METGKEDAERKKDANETHVLKKSGKKRNHLLCVGSRCLRIQAIRRERATAPPPNDRPRFALWSLTRNSVVSSIRFGTWRVQTTRTIRGCSDHVRSSSPDTPSYPLSNTNPLPGARSVLLKGGHVAGENAADFWTDGCDEWWLSSPRVLWPRWERLSDSR